MDWQQSIVNAITILGGIVAIWLGIGKWWRDERAQRERTEHERVEREQARDRVQESILGEIGDIKGMMGDQRKDIDKLEGHYSTLSDRVSHLDGRLEAIERLMGDGGRPPAQVPTPRRR